MLLKPEFKIELHHTGLPGLREFLENHYIVHDFEEMNFQKHFVALGFSLDPEGHSKVIISILNGMPIALNAFFITDGRPSGMWYRSERSDMIMTLDALLYEMYWAGFIDKVRKEDIERIGPFTAEKKQMT